VRQQDAIDHAMAAIKALDEVDPPDDQEQAALTRDVLAHLGRIRAQVGWTVLFRPATDRDLGRCHAKEKASTEDGAVAIVIDGDLVAVADEYGTVTVRPGVNLNPELLENAVESLPVILEGVTAS
jgi:hypothetical protein